MPAGGRKRLWIRPGTAGYATRMRQRDVVARVLQRSAELFRPALDRLEALPAPEGKQAQAHRFISLLRDTVPVIENSAEAIRQGDEAAAREANQRILELALPARRLARELDIDEACIAGQSAP